jgi:ribonuclease HI
VSRCAVTVRVDGASRGNPGPAGIGAVIEFLDGRAPVEVCAYIGETTNNVAEYRALLLALEEAGRHRPEHLTVYSDSELLVRQLKGQYKVKAEHLRPLFLGGSYTSCRARG